MHRTGKKISASPLSISVTAASSVLDPKLLEKGLARFARWGYPVHLDDTLLDRHRYLAGGDDTRAQALVRAIKDPSVGTIWCARGGYGALRILSRLDKLGAPAAMKKNPKLLLGYSDATALHCYFYERCGLPSVHAPMPATGWWQRMKPGTDALLQSLLRGELALGAASHTARWPTKNFFGAAKASEGVVLGGNLTLIVNLIGTPWQPDLRGKILFLEDCGERPYRVDRMLTQLENAGMLKSLAGVLLGDFEADVEYAEPKLEKRYWREIFAERFEGRGYPVLHRLPVGHGKRNEPLPLGVKARITKNGKLWLLDQPVSPIHR